MRWRGKGMSILKSLLCIGAVLCATDVIAQNTFPSTGNVGIGTTNPGATLEVNGNARIDGPLTIQNSGTTQQFVVSTSASSVAQTWWTNGSYGYGSGIGTNNAYTLWG